MCRLLLPRAEEPPEGGWGEAELEAIALAVLAAAAIGPAAGAKPPAEAAAIVPLLCRAAPAAVPPPWSARSALLRAAASDDAAAAAAQASGAPAEAVGMALRLAATCGAAGAAGALLRARQGEWGGAGRASAPLRLHLRAALHAAVRSLSDLPPSDPATPSARARSALPAAP